PSQFRRKRGRLPGRGPRHRLHRPGRERRPRPGSEQLPQGSVHGRARPGGAAAGLLGHGVVGQRLVEQRVVGQRLLGRGELEQLAMTRGMSIATRSYIAAVSLVALIAAALLWRNGAPAAGVTAFLLVAGLGALAHAYPIQGFRHQAYQVTLPFIVIAAAMFSAAQLVAFIILIHLAEQARVRRRPSIQWFNVCNYLISAAIAALLFTAGPLLFARTALTSLIRRRQESPSRTQARAA